MRKIIIQDKTPEGPIVYLRNVGEGTPIFAKRNGVLTGMVVYEKGKGWILRTGGTLGCDGHHETRRKCMESASSNYGYMFYT